MKKKVNFQPNQLEKISISAIYLILFELPFKSWDNLKKDTKGGDIFSNIGAGDFLY